jgi:hypothetical protein
MSDLPLCHWCLRDPVNGISVFAGFFQLRGAIDEGLKLMASERPVPPGLYTRPWLLVEPWFQTQEQEFQFWAEWWAIQDAPIDIPPED